MISVSVINKYIYNENDKSSWCSHTCYFSRLGENKKQFEKIHLYLEKKIFTKNYDKNNHSRSIYKIVVNNYETLILTYKKCKL